MEMSESSLNKKDFNIKSTDLYLCNERNTKLIYKNLTTQEVIGIAGFLNGKIIEVIDKRIVNKQDFYKISHKESLIGWIALDNSIRLYRIPSLLGKYTPDKEVGTNYLGLKYDVTDFLNKTIEARYYFENEGTPKLLILNLGNDRKIMPVEFGLFHKLNVPPKGTTIKIYKGEELYQNSKFEFVDDTLKEDMDVKITGYYEKLEEVRIIIDGRKYWVKKAFKNKEANNFINTLENIELIDKIIFLKNENNMLRNRLKQEEKINEFMKQNISIDNDLQKLFLKRYLGDFNEIE